MKTYLSIFLLSISLNLIAQTNWHKCAYEHAIQQRSENNADYRARINAVFDESYRIGLQQNNIRTIHTIPVAVHVVWKNASDKIAECKITEQVNVLNEDYRRMNSDTINLRSIYDSIAADTEIEFRLDTIIWTQSNVDFHTLGPFGGLIPDPTSLDSVKGTSVALDPEKYLNIWIVNLGSGGLLGYAYPPDSLPNWPAGTSASSQDKEGVVLHNEIVGRTSTVTFGGGFGAPVTTISTQGRTATHEVGHYLGLRHIWGDGLSGGLFPQPSCSVDDGIGDTPNCLDRSNFDCDTTKNSCDISLPGDLPDMVENYMDYSEESCMNTFTTGQKSLMKGVLTASRLGLSTTPSKNRPVNDAVFNAIDLAVNTDGSCTFKYSATNSNASVSIPDAACLTTTANDVWFSFTASSSDLTLEIQNINNNSGNTSLAWELFEGSCDNLNRLSCDSSTSSVLSGLVFGNSYFIRVYSMAIHSDHNFDICLQDSNPLSNNQLEELLNKSLHVYPNPTNNIVNIEIENNIDFEGSINFYNSLGQSIGQSEIINNTNNKITLYFSEYGAGLYFAEITINGKKIIKKIVLNKL